MVLQENDNKVPFLKVCFILGLRRELLQLVITNHEVVLFWMESISTSLLFVTPKQPGVPW